MKYTNQQHKFICELLWGTVPLDRIWAEETSLYKEQAPILLNKFPLLDKSFFDNRINNMNVLDLLVGNKMKVMTDLKVEVELEIKEVEIKNHTRQITPDTRENDWWGESIDWKTYFVKYTNGASKEFNNITDIKII